MLVWILLASATGAVVRTEVDARALVQGETAAYEDVQGLRLQSYAVTGLESKGVLTVQMLSAEVPCEQEHYYEFDVTNSEEPRRLEGSDYEMYIQDVTKLQFQVEVSTEPETHRFEQLSFGKGRVEDNALVFTVPLSGVIVQLSFALLRDETDGKLPLDAHTLEIVHVGMQNFRALGVGNVHFKLPQEAAACCFALQKIFGCSTTSVPPAWRKDTGASEEYKVELPEQDPNTLSFSAKFEGYSIENVRLGPPLKGEVSRSPLASGYVREYNSETGLLVFRNIPMTKTGGPVWLDRGSQGWDSVNPMEVHFKIHS